MNDEHRLDAPLFDVVHLSGFTGGDIALEALFLEEFCRNARENMEQMEHSVGAEEWRALTHKLKGAARAVGVWTIAAWCEAAEQTPAMALGPEKQAFFNRITAVIIKLEQHVEALKL